MATPIVAEAAAAPIAQTAHAQLPQGERIDIAVEAAWELEAIAAVMLRELKDVEPDQLRFRPMAMRVKQLAGLVMSCLGDGAERHANLWAKLQGIQVDEGKASRT